MLCSEMPSACGISKVLRSPAAKGFASLCNSIFQVSLLTGSFSIDGPFILFFFNFLSNLYT